MPCSGWVIVASGGGAASPASTRVLFCGAAWSLEGEWDQCLGFWTLRVRGGALFLQTLSCVALRAGASAPTWAAELRTNLLRQVRGTEGAPRSALQLGRSPPEALAASALGSSGSL